MDESGDRQPWDRREGESAKAHHALMVYLRMGFGRSLAAVADELYPRGDSQATDRRRVGHLERWSSEYEWVARAAAWDAWVEQRKQEAFLADNIRRNREQAEEALRLQAETLQRIRDLLDDSEPQQLGALARILSDAIKVERTARGLDTEEDKKPTADVVKIVFGGE